MSHDLLPAARHRPKRGPAIVGALLAIAGVLAIPAIAAAHPLGNFTINHYTGIRVEPDRILLDVVIDQAEIPTFQARLGFDTDGDGEVSDAEIGAGRVTACQDLGPSLALTLDDANQTLTLVRAGLTFPQGVGGLSTMRMVCGFEAGAGRPIAAGSRIGYADTSFPERLGWREIVVAASGMTLAGDAGELRTSSPSARLTSYPTTLLTQALNDTGVSFTASPGGPVLGAYDIPDASPVSGTSASSPPSSPGPVAAVATAAPAASPMPGGAVPGGAVPGGVTSGDLPSIFRTADLTPIVLLISILTAAALGAGHAVTPGHGKTLMAAYLVGTRGTPAHAVGLGLSVTLSHTLGILALAALVIGAQGLLPPDVVVKAAPVVAAISIVAIGGWMLINEGRRRWRLRAIEAERRAAHEQAHTHGDAHDHPPEGPGHDVTHDHGGHDHAHDHGTPAAGEHSHGGVSHTHLPPAGSTISWRSLFVLGLAGGLIPSTSALLILLGSIAAGRPAFGIVLVIAFGLGMAVVMGGIGIALVLARGRLDRVDSRSRLGRVSDVVPLVAASVVFTFGLYLTVQAIAGSPTF